MAAGPLSIVVQAAHCTKDPTKKVELCTCVSKAEGKPIFLMCKKTPSAHQAESRGAGSALRVF